MRNILIVEDDNISFLLLKNLMSIKDWYQVIRVKNGREAVNICKRKRIDFIFMDNSMPVMDGVTATKKIREFNNKVPIVFQTGYSNKKNIRDALNAQANDYLVKPVNGVEVHEMLDKYLTNE